MPTGIMASYEWTKRTEPIWGKDIGILALFQSSEALVKGMKKARYIRALILPSLFAALGSRVLVGYAY